MSARCAERVGGRSWASLQVQVRLLGAGVDEAVAVDAVAAQLGPRARQAAGPTGVDQQVAVAAVHQVVVAGVEGDSQDRIPPGCVIPASA